MAWVRLARQPSHAPGFSVCRCGDVVDNNRLVAIARPEKSKGIHCCPDCADRMTGGNNHDRPGRHPDAARS